MHSGANLGIMRHILPDKHFLTTKKLRFTKDKILKYYDTVFILFHTGMRISEFCGLTVKDIDLEGKTVSIDHQLQRNSDMSYHIETPKTNAGVRRIPITDEVADCFASITFAK